ncbi:hypothetical protein OIU34_03680 [Pararhizobium sp. BT-229]|uniref:hypothetical protein n=1 Tax=Pararhizobium sp. BT-229 TaxID=2986923 RepID=UPI0021F7964F|nr:hypothetical protein [Pararhizobium sp. BT-229]MCV9960991.1 hypothetical protein [Pararhizobium sp. BT-229]
MQHDPVLECSDLRIFKGAMMRETGLDKNRRRHVGKEIDAPSRGLNMANRN